MREDINNPATPSKPFPLEEDGIPVLRDIAHSGDQDFPMLDSAHAVATGEDAGGQSGLTTERLAELADTLQLTLNRELDYAIDGAVYERLQAAMEEVAASVKKQVHAQLEQRLPELIEQTLRHEN